MKLFEVSKDGGPDSTVTAFWLVEIKSLFSVCLLRFGPGSRDEFHSHAFNSVGWLLKGLIQEQFIFPQKDVEAIAGSYARVHKPSLKPIVVKRSTFHRVFSFGTSWVLNIRGPWAKDWLEWSPAKQEYSRLTNGRKVEERWK